MRTDGDGRSKIHAVLSFDGRTLTPQLIEELIDFYEFTQKSLGGMKVKIG